jgi:hypothetical protein
MNGSQLADIPMFAGGPPGQPPTAGCMPAAPPLPRPPLPREKVPEFDLAAVAATKAAACCCCCSSSSCTRAGLAASVPG